MTDQELAAVVRSIETRGVNRVLINADGEATTEARARELGITRKDIYIIFIRNDGWSLAATKDMAAYAYGLWPAEWVAFIERPNGPKPISEYRLG